MPHTTSTVRTLDRDLAIAVDENADEAMERIDRVEVAAVCRHLVGDLGDRTLVATGGRS